MARPPRFHTKPLRRRKEAHWLTRLWRKISPWVTLAIVAGIAALIMRMPDRGGDWRTANVTFTLCGKGSSRQCVIDGDTIIIGKRKIRLTGFNAPEMQGECPAESALAMQSRAALQSWLNQGPFVMDGGDNPPYDQYGRELRALKRGDEWLSDIMIARGLAQGSGWGFTRGGWCD